jgi:protein-S-isoprenylcysteine O-methyltransferase Ste14
LRGKAVLGLAQLLAILALVLFGSAGRLDYPRAWIYLAVFGLSAGLISAYLTKYDPALLERRIRGGPRAETETFQKAIQAAAALAFIAIFCVAGFDCRFRWSHVPPALSFAGDVAVALGFSIVLRVFRENTYTGATIEVAAGQTVVTTGPYALVRHPMYAGALIMLAATPVALGSWWALVPVVAMLGLLIARLLDEEKLLAAQLPQYADYCRTVRYRLVPAVW